MEMYMVGHKLVSITYGLTASGVCSMWDLKVNGWNGTIHGYLHNNKLVSIMPGLATSRVCSAL